MDTLATCCYCDASDGDVILVATCNGTCGGEVRAHLSCFSNRRKTQVYKKKMKQRGNRDAEVCPHSGCLGKVLQLKREPIRTMAITDQSKKHSKTVFDQLEKTGIVSVAQGETMCTFLGRDGTPCRRSVVGGTTACKQHKMEWTVMQKMLCPPCASTNSFQEEQTVTSTREVAIQTEPDPLFLENKVLEKHFQKLLEELKSDKKEAEGRLASIRTSVLELLMQ